MAIATTENKTVQSGNGVTTEFPVPFMFYENSHLDVYLVEKATGTLTPQTLTTHYTVSGAGVATGGTVTMLSAPSNLYNVLIERNVPVTQGMDLKEGDKFPADTVERAFDLLTMIAQDHEDAISRSLRTDSNDALDMLLPPVQTRKNTYLAFDGDGLPIAAGLTTVVGSTVVATGSVTARAFTDRFAEVFNVKDYGAVGNGVADDTVAIQSAITAASVSGGYVFFPRGTYKVTASLNITGSGVQLIGQGPRISNINSSVIGASTINVTTAGLSYLCIKGFSITGNGLSGASGNGHCIGFKSPSFGSPYSPQQSLVDSVEIRDFKGTGDTNGHGTGIGAAAIMCYGGLQNTYRKVYVNNCTFGFYLDQTQNERLDDCLVDGASTFGLLALTCERLTITGGDFVGSGSNTTYALPGFNAPTGNMAIFESYGVTISGTKYKNGNRSNLICYICKGVSLNGGFIRANDEIGAYFVSCPGGIAIDGVEFDCAVGSAATPRYLVFYDQAGNGCRGIKVTGCHFRVQGAQNVTSMIEFIGSYTADPFCSISVRNNFFGDINVGAPVTVTSYVKFSNCTLTKVEVKYNSFQALTNATITNAILLDGTAGAIAFDGVDLSCNEYIVNGGTITNKINLVGPVTFSRALVAPTYGANVTIDCTAGTTFNVVATNGSAFQINTPINPSAAESNVITIRVKNTSGGALGAITFAAGYKLGAAWTQPANGNSRSIQFAYDGANWIEVGRTAADVAN